MVQQMFRRCGLVLAASFLAAFFPLPTLADALAGGAPAAASTVTAPAEVAQSNPFSDVPADSWAFAAIQQLAADGLIKGYPSGTFKGNRPMTRYEAAVLTDRAVVALEAMLAKDDTAAKVNASDVQAVKKLVDEFSSELKAVEKDVAALKARVDTLDQTVGSLNKNVGAINNLRLPAVHLYYFVRAPGSFNENVSAQNGPMGLATANGGLANVPAGATMPNGVAFTTGSNPSGTAGEISQAALTTGDYTHGAAYQVMRAKLVGTIDSHFSYAARIDYFYYMDNSAGKSITVPNYCIGAACAVDYPNNAGVRINYAFMQYNSPGGFYAQGGRFPQLYSAGGWSPGLGYSNFQNGVQLGYTDPRGVYYPNGRGFDASVGYGVGTPSASNPIVGVVPSPSEQAVWGHVQYAFDKHLTLGVAEDINSGYKTTLWNPSALLTYPSGPLTGHPIVNAAGFPITGAYQATSVPIASGSMYGTYRINQYLAVDGEVQHRFGNDPFTGTAWQQSNSFWGELMLGRNPLIDSSAPGGTNWAVLGYVGAGFNSTGADADINAFPYALDYGTPDANGYRIWYAGFHHKINKDLNIGIIWAHEGIPAGTSIPAGSNACPGCFITQDTKNQVFLETLYLF
jgi:hypothetical protein